MFNNTKYTKIYYSIVNRAWSRPTVGYVERHHIIPKSMGGSNDRSNIVSLTAREHFICHRLLTKMVLDPKHKISMANAVWMMQSTSGNQLRYHIAGHTYAKMKQDISEAYRLNPNHRSESSKRKQSTTMKGRKHTTETKAKLSEAMIGKNKGKVYGPSSLKGTILSDDVKKKISNTLKGRPGVSHTDESKKKISESKKGKPIWSDEEKVKMSASRRGKPKSPEHKAQLSEAASARWARTLPESNA